jgi:hypothetical protein
MISRAFRWFAWIVINVIFLGVLTECFYFVERMLELLECSAKDILSWSFWANGEAWTDNFIKPLIFLIPIAALFFVDRFQEGFLRVWRNIFPDDKPNERIFEIWKRVALILAPTIAALIIGYFNLHEKCR